MKEKGLCVCGERFFGGSARPLTPEDIVLNFWWHCGRKDREIQHITAIAIVAMIFATAVYIFIICNSSHNCKIIPYAHTLIVLRVGFGGAPDKVGIVDTLLIIS